ncbi:Skp1 domain-containing protein [Heracleum sosnowskyi]|uniref:Skp1 domain-containing protein n=1 Tax=Heracleum sosnowskyi TaxID=360622 RepID=A0AAD8I155_9APIA|nr:Skp1 domain-containing protein [Heracleum sosnowskyi]
MLELSFSTSATSIRLFNMSRSLNTSLLSKLEKEPTKNETKKPSIWFQTAAGEMVELEYELGWQSPLICEKLKCGVGSTRSSPIYLDPNVKKEALELIFDYFRFHQAPGRSDKECKLFVDEFVRKDTDTLCLLVHAAECLRLEELLDMVCRAIARNIETSSREVKHEFASLCEKSLEAEGLNLQVNQNGDLRLRLTRKMLAKQKKDLQAVENVKKVEALKHDDRSVDDLISFINGGDGDAKGSLRTVSRT